MLTGDFLDRCDPDAMLAFENGLMLVQQLCKSVVDLELGIDLVEADDWANLLGRDLLRAYGPQIKAAPRGTIGSEFQEWLDLYETVTDADYASALDEKRRVTDLLAQCQHEVDVLVCPTLRAGASTLAEVVTEDRHVRTGNVALFNLTGQPSLTVPHGNGANGLPLGMLFTGRPGEDETVLAVGAAFEALGHSSCR